MSVQKGFSLIELIVVIAIVGVIGSVGFVAYKGLVNQSKESSVKQQCSEFKTFMMSTLTQCALSPSSKITLMGIGGRPDETQDYSCDRSINKTHGFTQQPIANHFNNIHKNVYGMVGGHSGPVSGGGSVCNPQSLGGNCNPYDILEGNSFHMLSLGRIVLQSQDDGNLAVTCFYDQGEFAAGGNGVITEALKWTTPEKFLDPRRP